MVMKIGMIGYSEGNGHPFSFSAIINGYDATAMTAAGWTPIVNYLQKQKPEDFGFKGIKVTHAWTQDPKVTQTICQSCFIDNPVHHISELLGAVDAVIIARDDWESHYPLAKPFLEANIPVFIDKPLTLNVSELEFFEPYLERGQLMSTSGLRYAKELHDLRTNPNQLGEIKLIQAVVLNELSRYGIHMLDAVAGLDIGMPTQITRTPGPAQSCLIEYDNSITLQLSCLGAVAKTFHMSIFGTQGHMSVNLHDNFAAFRQTLHVFFEMITSGNRPIEPQQVLQTMRLIARGEKLPYYQPYRL